MISLLCVGVCAGVTDYIDYEGLYRIGCDRF